MLGVCFLLTLSYLNTVLHKLLKFWCLCQVAVSPAGNPLQTCRLPRVNKSSQHNRLRPKA
jgi:hypothetical protein